MGTWKTKKQELLEWLRDRRWATTSDVIKWGSDHYSTRADRDARQLAEEGLIRRATDEEKERMNKRGKQDVWLCEK